MKINIKTLRGDLHELEVEESATVQALKEQIESVLHHRVELQKLVYSGKVLVNDRPLSSYEIEEGSSVVLMVVTKPVSESRDEEAKHKEEGERKEEEPERKEAEPVPSEPESGNNSLVQSLAEMGFPEDQVRAALKAANNNPDRALEFLMNGIPSENPLSFLIGNPSFEQIKTMIQRDPSMLRPLMEQLSQSNPELANMIMQNQDAFMQLINDRPPVFDPEMIARLPKPPANQNTLKLNADEAACVRRLCMLSFHPKDALEAFLACDRNEELAASMLFENYNTIELPFNDDED